MNLLRYNLHIIKYTHFQCTVQCVHILINVYGSIITIPTNLWNISITPLCGQYLCHVIPGPTQSLISLKSLKFRLSRSRISYKWNHTVCTLLCLAFFIHHNILRYIQAVVYLSSLFLFIELCHYIMFILSPTTDRHFSCFQLGATMNKSAMNICIHVFCGHAFSLL